MMMPKQKPSFFKVLVSDFTPKLLIPPAFARDYEKSCLSGENFTLRISSGKTWAVKMVKTENEKYEFTGGWNKFAKDVELKKGEFLVFSFVAKSSFDVSIFAVTCCERQIEAVIKTEDDDDEVEYKNLNAGDKQSKAPNGRASKSDHLSELQKSPLYFEVRLKNYQKYRLAITKKFCKAAGLMDKGSVDLEYLPNHHHPQSVVLDHIRNQSRIDMAVGWPKFKKVNGLVIGKTYSFQFRPRKNVIQVQEVKKTKFLS